MTPLWGRPLRQADEKELTALVAQGKIIRFAFVLDPRIPEAVSYVRALEYFLAVIGLPSRRVAATDPAAAAQCRELATHADTAFVLVRPLPAALEKDLLPLLRSDCDPDMAGNDNKARLYQGDLSCLPATARSALRLLLHYRIPLSGRKALVIGRSPTVGLPLFMALMRHDAFVTLAHSKVAPGELRRAARAADIVVLASGQRGLVDATCLHAGQTLLDCGYHAADNGGDLGFVPPAGLAGFYAPVPGGVGPLTVTSLVLNAYRLKGLV